MLNFFRKDAQTNAAHFILPAADQIKAWRKTNRKMKWGISAKEFAAVGPPSTLSQQDQADGFIGSILSYGFGDDGRGNADAVLSGRMAWLTPVNIAGAVPGSAGTSTLIKRTMSGCAQRRRLALEAFTMLNFVPVMTFSPSP